MTPRDTIYALSSGGLPSGIAVVRISGSAVPEVANSLLNRLPTVGRATLVNIRSQSGAVLDRGVSLLFRGPHSATGEDVLELYLHGGRATVAIVLKELGDIEGLRAAEAGEFTKRAFLNGKMDLTEVEALSDLLAAETEAQRRLALENSLGAQRQILDVWRSRIIHFRAMIEAVLDFSDEEDAPLAVSDGVWQGIETLAGVIRGHLAGFQRAEIVRDGLMVAIVGDPNVGKSSLLNLIAQRDVAIVSDEPGTTRDVIEVAMDLDGYKVILCDTAGLREDAGAVERLGIERTRDRIQRSGVIINLSVGGEWLPDDGRMLRVSSQSDRLTSVPGSVLSISTRTGDGIEALLDLLSKRVKEMVGSSVAGLPSRHRHLDLLRSCASELEAVDDCGPLEGVAERLRVAGDLLGRVAGRIDVEDLLDVVFTEFCIGK